MNGLNLHNIVSGVLTSVQPTESVKVYQCSGIRNVAGDIVRDYGEGVTCKARFQIDSDEALEHIDNVNQNMVLRKIYINTTADNRISEINRVAGKGADYIYRVSDNTWWMVNASYDEFAAQGWVCVRGCLQLTAPKEIVNAG